MQHIHPLLENPPLLKNHQDRAVRVLWLSKRRYWLLEALEVKHENSGVGFYIDFRTCASKEHELVYLALVFPSKFYN
jgi:hypothetical protein